MTKTNGILGQGLWLISSAAVLGLMTLSGCTPSAPTSSKLGISIPATISKGSQSLDKQSNLSLSHIVVNVTGPGISSSILYVWDQCHGCVAPLAVPIHYLEVPTGTDRLVQALAVYKDQSGGTSVYYGDAVASLSKSEETLSISMTSIFTGSTLISGAIAGRYLTTASSGPTGQLEIRYQPPNDRPALILEKTEIVSGWFTALAVKGIAFRYVVAGTGLDLFGKAVDLADSVFTPSDRVANVFHPVYSYNGENGGLVNSSEAERHVIGYFGAGASGKLVCHKFSGSDSLDGHFQRGTTTDLTVEILSGSEAVPTDGELTNTTSPRDRVSIKGGLNANTAGNSCSNWTSSDVLRAAHLYSDFLPLTIDNFSEGRSGIGGFKGIFGRVKDIATVNSNLIAFEVGDGTSPMVMFEAGGELQVGGKVLPGVRSLISGIKFFKIPNAMMNVDDVQMAPCSEFSKTGNSYGAVELSSVVLDLMGRFFGPSGYDTAAMTASAHLGICFLAADGSLYKNGYVLSSDKIGGGGGDQGPYLKLEGQDGTLGREGDVSVLTTGVCHKVVFKNYTGSGTGTAVAESVEISSLPTSVGSVARFYSDANCTADLSVVTISSGSMTSNDFYMRADSEHLAAFGVSPTVSPTTYSYDSAYDQMKVINPFLELVAPVEVLSGECYEYTVSSHYGGGNTRNVSGAAMAITVSGITPYITQSDCLAETPPWASPSIPVNSFSVKFFGKLTATGSVQVAATDYDPSSQIVTVAVSGANQAIYVKTGFPQGYFLEKCNEVRFSLVNGAGTEITAQNNFLFTPAVAGFVGVVSSNPNCVGSAGMLTIPKGASHVAAWVMFVASTATIEFTMGTTGVKTYPGGSAFTSILEPTSGNYIVMTAPVLANKVLGSHEFSNLPRNISFQVPAGATITCAYQNPGESNWTACATANLTGTTYAWTSSEAVAKRRLKFSSKVDGESWKEVVFDPVTIYGEDFSVIACDDTITSNFTSSDLTNKLSSKSNICLADGVQWTCDSMVTLGVGKKIVGWSSKNMVPMSAVSAGYTCLNVDTQSAIAVKSVVANLSFSVDGSSCLSGTYKGIKVSGASGTGTVDVAIVNSSFSVKSSTACYSKGVSLESNFNVGIQIGKGNFVLDGTAANTVGIYLNNILNGSASIRNSQFTSQSSTNPVIGIEMEKVALGNAGNGGSAIEVRGNTFSGANLVAVNSTETSNTAAKEFRFINNLVDVTGIYRSTIKLLGGTATFVNNIIRFTSESPSSGILEISPTSTAQTAYFTANQFVHRGLGHAIASNPGSSINVSLVLDQNHFLSTSTSSSGNSRIVSGAGSGTTSVGKNYPLTSDFTGLNYVCETNSGNGWSGSPIYVLPGTNGLTGLSVGYNPALTENCFQ